MDNEGGMDCWVNDSESSGARSLGLFQIKGH